MANTVPADETARQGYPIHTIDLPGLPRAVVVSMPHARTAVVEVFVRAGSAYETVETNGISHLLEHVVCAGTRRYPTRNDLQLAIDQTGGVLEAFTHKELTEFVFHVVPDMVPRAIELLGEALVNASLSPAVVESERQIVLEEMLEGSHEGAHDPFSELMWGTSSLGLPIIGRRGVIERLTSEDLRAFWLRTYTRDAMLVCVAGAVDESLVEKALESFRGVPASPSRLLPSDTNATAGSRRYHVERFGAQTVDVTLLFRANGNLAKALHHGHGTALTLFTECFQAHVYQQLIGPRLPVYYLGAGHQSLLDQGCVYFYLKVHRTRFEETVTVMLEELDRLRVDGIAEDQLDLSKRRHELRTLADVIDPRFVAGRVGADRLLHGERRAMSIEEELTHLGEVGPSDIRAASDALFRAENLCAVIRGGISWWEQRQLKKRLEAWLQ